MGRCHDVPRVAGLLHDPRRRMVEDYMAEVSKDLCTRHDETAKSDLKVVYTAMHGVGCPFASELMERFGYSKGLILGKSLSSRLWFTFSKG